jgi:hypothetical protein
MPADTSKEGVEMNCSDDAPPRLLARRPYGIETFRVRGTLESEPVRAQWDGTWVILSTVLCDRVTLAMAVDEAFSDPGVAPQFRYAPLRGSPEELMLAVLTCCDAVDIAEFDVDGYHRVIAPDLELRWLRED